MLSTKIQQIVSIKRQFRCVMVIFACFAIALLWKLISYMIIDEQNLKLDAIKMQTREREITAPRGQILDRNRKILADNQTVYDISVIHAQVHDKETVISVLSKELGMDEDKVRARVEKVSSREKIANRVDFETANRIQSYELDGVKIDVGYKRYYPYGHLASKVLGFAGGDNQGILGLEVKYEGVLAGTKGSIGAITDVTGKEVDNREEVMHKPVSGKTLITSIDVNIQSYAEQLAYETMDEKEANYVSIIVMNPQNGEIYAMVNTPEYDLNDPFAGGAEDMNQVWRNGCINDTYEPGSIFKTVTATAALELGVVNENSTFYCPGYRNVGDRRIRCHKTTGHGQETFTQGIMNSCNPVFIDTGLNVGVTNFYLYMEKLGLLNKTGVDLPGEASTIIHNIENVGPVELATMSFGQSFQVTPIAMLRGVSAIVNGGTLVTPHFGVAVQDENGEIHPLAYETKEQVISESTSIKMRSMLQKVIEEGGGSKAIVEGYAIGGKTATSQKLPRSACKYIASFIGFAPADHPQVIAICIIDEPQGVYYGGTIAAPVIAKLYENILPYLGIEKKSDNHVLTEE